MVSSANEEIKLLVHSIKEFMKRSRHSLPVIGPSKPAIFAFSSDSIQVFTLSELIIVLAIFVVFGALLLPALAATHDRSSRAVCQYNLRQIAVAATQYAGDNNDYVFPAAVNENPLAFQASQPVSKIGLATNGASIWTCPNRHFPRASWEPMIIGYQYYGGVTNWINAIGDGPSHSPVKLSQSKPYLMLAADIITQLGATSWGGSNYHHTADSLLPQGGNEAFCDGSVQWIDIHKMYNFHSIGDPSFSQVSLLYFYQDITDDPYWSVRLSALYRAGVTSPGIHW